MTNTNDQYHDSETELSAEEVMTVADQIYSAYLPPYLQQPWDRGKGKWYEDWLRQQLNILLMDELCDDPTRLAKLLEQQDYVTLVFGIFGACSRILDHMGMHLRAQTLGQYELLPEDEALLRALCHRFLQLEQSEVNPFSSLDLEEDD